MKLKPPQVVVLSFLAAITVGTLLLSLPAASTLEGGADFIDRLFTATSATCVTGLIVLDTPRDWAPFGRAVIFALFQIGGLGIMTLSTFFAVLLGRKLTLRQNVVIQSAMNHNRVLGAKRLIKYIIGLTFTVEIIGAGLLFLRWSFLEKWTVGERLAQSLFHAVSAFCNAGFSLFSYSFMDYPKDLAVNAIMMALIITGGLGFIVILDLARGLFQKRNYAVPRLVLQSKVVIFTSLALITAGALLIFLLERGNTMSGMSAKGMILGSLFQSVTARTAGFNTLAIGEFAPGTLVVLLFLMFIGASPGSTGGGIKTSTFAIVLASVGAMSRNRDRVFMMGRTIPRAVVRRALLVFIMALAWIGVMAFLLVIAERNTLAGGGAFMKSLFEVTSAFGTVGLSTGITPHLTTIGKIIIIVTMFVGRVGPLTLALAVAINEDKIKYSYPEEKIMVG